MSKFNITNRTSGVRSFAAGDRYLTLAGGESERGLELSKDESEALIATKEFDVVEIEAKQADAPAAAKPAPIAPADEQKNKQF